MKKRLLSILLPALMIAFFLPTVAFAETENCPDCNGTGKQGCNIYDYSDLCYMCDDDEKQVDLTQNPAEKNKFTFTTPASKFEEAGDTFKAVWNSKTGVLSFFYDKLNHTGEGISVFVGLPTEATAAEDWPYDSIREDVEGVVIDSSVANYTGLISTAYMFDGMSYASVITGAESLKLDNVTNMACMFSSFGSDNKEMNTVPNVSGWNTENVTNMSSVFSDYCLRSTNLDKVPDVSGWETENVIDMSNMFYHYGLCSANLNKVPNVSGWKTGNVTNMSGIFSSYGFNSTLLDQVPNVSGWNTENVTNMSLVFSCYSYGSTKLDKVPNVSEWETEKVTDMNFMFFCYGYSSLELDAVPAVGTWKTGEVTDMRSMFYFYGATSQKLNFSLNLSSWDLSKAESVDSMFYKAGANAAEWKVCIPYVTGALKNTTSNWYGKDDTVSAVPLTSKQFTLIYPISVDGNIQNGNVETNVATAESNSTVSITVIADNGFVLKTGSLKATYNDGLKDRELELIRNQEYDEIYYFTMPAAEVSITAEFARPAAAILNFDDYTETPYYSLDEALDAVYSGELIVLLKDIMDMTTDITVPSGAYLDLDNYVLKTTGKIVNNGCMILYQENAELIDYLFYNAPGRYSVGENLTLPDADAPDCIIPEGSIISVNAEKDSVSLNLDISLADESLIWNADISAGMQLRAAYALKLGGDILGVEGSGIKKTKVTATYLTLSDDITIGNNDPGAGEAVLFIESLYFDKIEAKIGTFNANGKKITLNKTGVLMVSSDVDFDESVLVSGVPGKGICKLEDKAAGTVTYYAGPKDYEINAGSKREWTKGETAGLVITSDAPFEKFVAVKVDGTVIAASNYTAKEGSTNIMLAPAYLQTLSVGTHSIEIVSLDGSAMANFTIKANVPGTGDTSNMLLWIGLAVVSGMGISVCLMVGRKKRNAR